MGEVRLTREQADLANRIKQLDAELDDLDVEDKKLTQWGLHGSGAGVGALIRGRNADGNQKKRKDLLSERQALAQRLQTSISKRSSGQPQ